MVKLRLKRYGRKKQPSYRIVAMDSRNRRDGKAIEELGFYNPITNETRIDITRILKRLKQGAQVTRTVQNILNKAQTVAKEMFICYCNYTHRFSCTCETGLNYQDVTIKTTSQEP